MKKLLIILMLVLPTPVMAQTSGQTTEQKVFDVLSYGTLAVNVALDVHANLNWTTAVRYGTTAVAVTVLKHYFPSARPCSPQCGIDSPDSNIPSGHVAFSVASLNLNDTNGKRLAVGISASTLTALFRNRANKHDLIGIGAGALVGLATGQIR